MKKSNRLLSGILAAVMSLMTTVGTFAPMVSAEPTAAAENGGRDYTVEGSNSFGNIVMDEFDINKQADSTELKKSNAASITRVAVSGKTAYVDYSSNFDCTLLVGIYDESGAVMYGSGNAELKEGSYVASVDINIAEMPQYFLVKAYIVDSFSNIPVALVYETNEYTQVVQEFLSKTAADFDADKVVVLDDYDDVSYEAGSDGMTDVSVSKAIDYSAVKNNFAVYTDKVKVISSSGTQNNLVHKDYKNNYYNIKRQSEH